MKQNNQRSKKLSVRRTTIRQLSGLDLTQAMGGGNKPQVYDSEATCASLKCTTG